MGHRFGSWQLDELIAVGGIGEVWRASRGDGDAAAIKRLHSHLLRNNVARAQFAIEQQLATTLPRHPHLVHASEAGEISGQPYVALELIPGQDVRPMAAGKAALTRSGVVAIVGAACDAAAHLHAHGWIHGDINPGNLIVDLSPHSLDGSAAHPGTAGVIDLPPHSLDGSAAHPGTAGVIDLSPHALPGSGDHPDTAGAIDDPYLQGGLDRVVLVDLGIARRAGAAGAVRGTHAYMAPEQIRGEAWTPATDVFALGVVCWELVSGARLFHRGPPWLSMAAVMETEPAALPDPSLDAIVRAALDKNPDARTPSPEILAAALRALLRNDGGV